MLQSQFLLSRQPELRLLRKTEETKLKGALKCSFFAVAALVGAGLLSCCLLRQPASFTAQPTNEQFQDPLISKNGIKTVKGPFFSQITKTENNRKTDIQ